MREKRFVLLRPLAGLLDLLAWLSVPLSGICVVLGLNRQDLRFAGAAVGIFVLGTIPLFALAELLKAAAAGLSRLDRIEARLAELMMVPVDEGPGDDIGASGGLAEIDPLDESPPEIEEGAGVVGSPSDSGDEGEAESRQFADDQKAVADDPQV